MRCGFTVIVGALLLPGLSAGQCTPDDFVTKSKPAIIGNISISGTRTLDSVELRTIQDRLGALCVDKDDHLATHIEKNIVDAFQRRGFFKAALRGPVEIRSVDSLSKPIPLNISASVNEGDRYRFGNVAFKGNKAFNSEELRTLLPLKQGDVFDIEKIRQALKAFRNLYGNRGYINFTPVPDTIFNDSDHTISLAIDFDEGQQFRVGHFEVAAVPALAQALVNDWELKTGDIYDASKVETFLVQHADVMQPGSLQIKQNSETKTVDIRFVICPPDYYCFDR